MSQTFPWAITAQLLKTCPYKNGFCIQGHLIRRVVIVGHLYEVKEEETECNAQVKDATGSISIRILKQTGFMQNETNIRKLSTLKDRFVRISGELHPTKVLICHYIEPASPASQKVHMQRCCEEWGFRAKKVRDGKALECIEKEKEKVAEQHAKAQLRR